MKALNYLKDKVRFLIAFVICCFALQGCTPLTNEEVIQEKNKCVSGDMDYQVVQNVWTYEVMRVVCIRKR